MQKYFATNTKGTVFSLTIGFIYKNDGKSIDWAAMFKRVKEMVNGCTIELAA